MDFYAAEQAFQGLEEARRTGRLDIEAYRQELMALRVTDAQGRTWMMQELTGRWYVWDQGQWQMATPPQPTAPPPPPAPPAPEPEPEPSVATEPIAPQAQAPEEPVVAQPEPVEPAAPEPVARSGGLNPVISPLGDETQASAPVVETVPSQPMAQPTPVASPVAPPEPIVIPSVQQAPTVGSSTRVASTGASSVQQAPAVGQSVAQAPASGQVISQAPATGYAPATPQTKHWRPSCLSVTLRLILWALLWSVIGWAVSVLLREPPLWAYLVVLGGALLHLVLSVRRMTRHGRETRAQAKRSTR